MTTLTTETPILHHLKTRPEPSATITLAQKARILKANGRNVIELAGGDPDFKPDSHVVKALKDAIQYGETKYTHPRGIPELRKAITDKMRLENHIEADTEKEIIVTAGGKQAIVVTLMALLEHGQEVLIPTPSWVSYISMTQIAGGTSIQVAARQSNKFKVTIDELEEHHTSRSKILILNNPQNPTGQVYTKEEIEHICDWCVDRGIILVSDEVYEHIIFDDAHFYSPASNQKYRESIVTVNAVSKTFAMTGLRLGWVHAPENLTKKIDPYHQHIITCASSIVQWGALAALTGSKSGILQRKSTYSNRRDLVVKLLGQSGTIKVLVPEGTFYIFLDIKNTGLNSMDFCGRLMDEGDVALCPGVAFGDAGEGWVRMLFARDDLTLTEACKRIIKVYG